MVKSGRIILLIYIIIFAASCDSGHSSDSGANFVNEFILRFEEFKTDYTEKVELGYDLIEVNKLKQSIEGFMSENNFEAAMPLLEDAEVELLKTKKFKGLIPVKSYKKDRFETILSYENNGVDVDIISYYSDNLKIFSYIYKPKNMGGKLPLIIYNHGGYTGLSSQDDFFLRLCRENNYIIAASAYRGEPLFVPLYFLENATKYLPIDSYPDDDIAKVFQSEGEFEGLKGEVDDILNLIESIKDLPFVDKERIGIIGGSHGGGNTALAMTRYSEVDVGISCAGILNPFRWHFEYIEEGKPGIYVESTFEQQMQYMLERSALNVAEYITVPLLIIVGDADTPSIYEMSLDFIDEMTSLGKTFEYKIYPGEVHGFYFGHPYDPILPEEEWKKDAEDAYQLMVSFLKKYI